jgi:hypothetical protein
MLWRGDGLWVHQLLTRLSSAELQMVRLAIEDSHGGSVNVDDFVGIFLKFVRREDDPSPGRHRDAELTPGSRKPSPERK